MKLKCIVYAREVIKLLANRLIHTLVTDSYFVVVVALSLNMKQSSSIFRNVSKGKKGNTTIFK